MEYRVFSSEDGELEYYILVGQAVGPVPYEDYGIKIHRRGGATAQVAHAADSPAKLQRLMDRLMDRHVGPEGLRRALSSQS